MQYIAGTTTMTPSALANRHFLAPGTVVTPDAHPVTVGAVRPRRTTQLVVDTRFGDSVGGANATATGPICAETNTYVPATVVVPLETRVANLLSMRVHSVEFPLQFYQYSSALQNTSFAAGTPGELTEANLATIPDGNYTASGIATALSAISGTGLAFSVSASSGRVVATNIGGGPVEVRFAVTSAHAFDRHRLKQKLGWMLGFREASYVIPSGGAVEAEAFFQEQTVRYAYLMVDDFVNARRGSLQSCAPELKSSALARVAIDYERYPFGSVIPATEANGYLWSGTRTYTESSAAPLTKVGLHFCDEFGRALPLNRAEYAACLEIDNGE